MFSPQNTRRELQLYTPNICSNLIGNIFGANRVQLFLGKSATCSALAQMIGVASGSPLTSTQLCRSCFAGCFLNESGEAKARVTL